MADPIPTLPPAHVPVLDATNALTLPWRRALEARGQQAAAGITQLTGDVAAGPGGGSQAATLAQTGVIPGTYANANITVDAKGRISAAADGAATAESDPLVYAALSITDGALNVAASYRLVHARTFTYTGDATGGPTSFDGSVDVSTALALAATGVTPGTYGDATHVGQFTVDAKGRLTFAQNVAISGSEGTAYAPLAMGTEPLTFVSDGNGHPIMVPFTP